MPPHILSDTYGKRFAAFFCGVRAAEKTMWPLPPLRRYCIDEENLSFQDRECVPMADSMCARHLYRYGAAYSRDPQQQGNSMNIFTYTLMCYGLTAVISLLVVVVVLGVNKVMHKAEAGNGDN